MPAFFHFCKWLLSLQLWWLETQKDRETTWACQRGGGLVTPGWQSWEIKRGLCGHWDLARTSGNPYYLGTEDRGRYFQNPGVGVTWRKPEQVGLPDRTWGHGEMQVGPDGTQEKYLGFPLLLSPVCSQGFTPNQKPADQRAWDIQSQGSTPLQSLIHSRANEEQIWLWEQIGSGVTIFLNGYLRYSCVAVVVGHLFKRAHYFYIIVLWVSHL